MDELLASAASNKTDVAAAAAASHMPIAGPPAAGELSCTDSNSNDDRSSSSLKASSSSPNPYSMGSLPKYLKASNRYLDPLATHNTSSPTNEEVKDRPGHDRE